jgi:hypothetical protein
MPFNVRGLYKHFSVHSLVLIHVGLIILKQYFLPDSVGIQCPEETRLCALPVTDYIPVIWLQLRRVYLYQRLLEAILKRRLRIPEDSHLHTRHCDKQESHVHKSCPWYCRGTYSIF